MIKVIVNAYSCSPYLGSEPGMAWNWCANLAKYCELYIITEGVHRDKIESVVPTLPQGGNMHFYYSPVPQKVRLMLRNQGDWRFYFYYWKWQKRTADIVRDICRKEHIDILHQLNLIGFREPGYLWKVSRETNIPFVWGPVGGLIKTPSNYLWSISKKILMKSLIKRSISAIQIRYSPSVRNAVRRADVLIGATNEETNTICKLYGRDVIQMNETGTNVSVDFMEHHFSQNEEFNIIWVGRFIPTKQLGLALRVMALLKRMPHIKLHIVGTGKNEKVYKEKATRLGLDKTCIWHGQIDNKEVQSMMRKSDLFFFTSIAEATSTVILEAISNLLPILCFDTCGFGSIVDDSIGRKIGLSTPDKSVQDFADIINHLYHHRSILVQMSDNCRKRAKDLSWENKAKQMVALYEEVLNRKKQA